MVTFQELISNSAFRIPDYQRGYAWGEKQLKDLWDDLEDIRQDEEGKFQNHYTGPIYVEEANISESEKWANIKHYFLVDGQQRITTLAILLFVLLKHEEYGYNNTSVEDLRKRLLYNQTIDGHVRVYHFDYSYGSKNSAFLRAEILEDQTTPVPIFNQTTYSLNLQFAKKFFEERVEALSHEQRELLFTKLTTALSFDLRPIDGELDVQAVFETLNNRGKPLSILEKLKNRLMFLSANLNEPIQSKEYLREIINKCWGDVYESLGSNPNNPLDEDEFLSAHLSIYRKPSESVFSESMADKKLFEMFSRRASQYNLADNDKIKEPDVSFDKIKGYVLSISEFAKLWESINNSSDYLIRRLFLLSNTKEMKIFLCALKKFYGDNSKNMLELTEQITFRSIVPGIRNFDFRTFADYARRLFQKEDSSSIEDEIKAKINEPIDFNAMINGFRGLFDYVYGNKGFHRWGGLKYLLFEYEKKLQEEYKEDDAHVSIESYNETTVEHVLPQKYDENWSETMDSIFSEHKAISDDEKYNCQRSVINSLGNLTILKGGKNSGLGNKSWEYKKGRFTKGSFNEIEISQQDSWNEETIRERGIKILKIMVEKIQNTAIFPEDRYDEILFGAQHNDLNTNIDEEHTS